MKTRVTTLKRLIILCSAFATMPVLGQAIFTWNGATDRTNLATAGNWNPNGLPSGATQDTAQWDGVTTSNLVLSYSGGWPGTAFGTLGVNFVLTANQTNSVNIISPVAQSGNIGLFGIRNSSLSASLILGDGTANRLNFVGRPDGAVHALVNDSAAAVIINPSVRWQAGGGASYTLDFGGSGDWTVNNYLRNDNNSGATVITVTGPGTMTWTAAGLVGNSAIGSVNIIGGMLVLKSSGLLAGQAIINNATLQYDAPAQSQTLSGVISGAGTLRVSDGTLTLSGANTYAGNTDLANNGVLVVGGAENEGISGPLGVGGTVSFNGGTLQWSVNSTFDYSARFSFEADQLYKFDTAGQSVTLASELGSSGGTLTKAGPGTLTLSSASSYSGATTVSAGKLAFQGPKSGSGNITVADGAVLGVTATGTTITPGALALGTSTGATLEFDNVSSTTTVPLRANTLSSAGTVTININSGTFAAGQSYPLLTWTSGPTPTFSLGTLNGAAGNLSVSGGTLRLNITGLAYVWSGANNGNWDTTTPNNWTVAGSPAAFANGGGALFDDTAPGATTVTLNAAVSPVSVTVNSSSKTYSIASSGANLIGGSGGLTKNGSTTLTLSGGLNAYTGATAVRGGILSVSVLANGGVVSDIGASDSGAGSLVLNGGRLQYTGGATSIDRLFTLGTSGGTIDASGSGALALNNSGSVGLSGLGPRGLTLTGTDVNDNTLAAAFADNGGATSLAKSGAGKWVLTGNNTKSGLTTIAAGTLQVGTGGASGSLGSGNLINNGALIFNRAGALTNGTVAGSGSVTKDGSGTVILQGDNTYSGGTTINAGTLQIGNGGATGKLSPNSPIVNNGTLIFHSTGAFTMSAGSTMSGTGQLIKRGSGLLKLISVCTYTGGTTIDPGAQLQIAEGNQGSFVGHITNNGSLLFVRQDNATLIINGNISGTGSVAKDVNNPNPGDVTLTGTNTYTGGTFIRGGGIILGDGGITPFGGSIVGNVIFTNSIVDDTAGRMLTFNYAEDFTLSGDIVGAVTGSPTGNPGAVVKNGAGTLTLAGNNTYAGGTTINAGTLQIGAGGSSGSIGSGAIVNNGVLVFDRAGTLTVGGVISGGGSVVKNGAGTVTLDAANTYTGPTTISNGTLVVNGSNLASSTIAYGGTLGGTGTFSGPVTLDAGTTLAPGASVGTLTFNSDLTIAGNLTIEVNKSLSPSNDLVVAGGLLANAGSGTLTVVNLGPALAVGDKFRVFSQVVPGGGDLTVTGAGATWINGLDADGSITVGALQPNLNFTRTGNSLQFSWSGSFKLQTQTNTIHVGLTANWTDYPGGAISPITVPIDVTKQTAFFRLASAP